MHSKWLGALFFIFIVSAITGCGGGSGGAPASTIGGGGSGGTGGGGIITTTTGTVSYSYDQNGRLSTAAYSVTTDMAPPVNKKRKTLS